MTAIQQDRVGELDLGLGNKRRGFLCPFVVNRYIHECKAVSGIPHEELVCIRHCLHTRAAPSRPEVHQNQLAFQGSQRERSALRGLEVAGRCDSWDGCGDKSIGIFEELFDLAFIAEGVGFALAGKISQGLLFPRLRLYADKANRLCRELARDPIGLLLSEG